MKTERNNFTYLAPTIKVIEVNTIHLICTSPGDNISEDDNNEGNLNNMPWDD